MDSPVSQGSAFDPERAGLRAPSPISRRPLAFAALIWACGSAAGYFSGAPAWLWFSLIAPFLALFVWKRRFSALLCALLFLSAGYTAWRAALPADFEREECALSGVVCAEPGVYEEYVLLTLNRVTVNGEAYPHGIRLYLYRNGAPAEDILYGDRVSLLGADIRAPKGRTGDGGYDQRATLWRRGVGAVAVDSALDSSIEPGENTPLRLAMRARRALGRKLDALFPGRSALARSLLLGDKSLLSEDTYEAFQRSGIVHILAVSGLHISTLAIALTRFLRLLRVSKRAAYWIVCPFLVLYAALTGFPASILRAAILYAIAEAGPLLDRPVDRVTGIGAAFLCLALPRPLSAFDAGFLLSFSAVLGMATLGPTLETALMPKSGGWLGKLARWGMGLIFASVSAILGMLPVVSRLYGAQTLWALLTNLLAIPLSTLALPATMLCCLTGLVWPAVGAALSYPADWFLRALEWLARAVASSSWRLEVALPGMGFPVIAAYALMLLAGSAQMPLGRLRGRRAALWKLPFIAGLIVVAALSNALTVLPVIREADVSITFADVGQGDGALINAQGFVYAVDTGEGGALSDRLTSKAIKLEAVFLTHPDSDHAGAIAETLDVGRAHTVYLPECWSRMEAGEEALLSIQGVAIRYLSAGDIVPLSPEASFEVLHPPMGYAPESDNDGSLVLLLRYGDGSALFMGDLPDSALDFAMPDCDIIKLAHHGAASSSGAFTLLAASPSAAILSVGLNGYGHPSPEVLGLLEKYHIPYYRTDERGDITVGLFKSGEIAVSCWLDERTGTEK